jgi:hypothetical protein
MKLMQQKQLKALPVTAIDGVIIKVGSSLWPMVSKGDGLL